MKNQITDMAIAIATAIAYHRGSEIALPTPTDVAALRDRISKYNNTIEPGISVETYGPLEILLSTLRKDKAYRYNYDGVETTMRFFVECKPNCLIEICFPGTPYVSVYMVRESNIIRTITMQDISKYEHDLTTWGNARIYAGIRGVVAALTKRNYRSKLFHRHFDEALCLYTERARREESDNARAIRHASRQQ